MAGFCMFVWLISFIAFIVYWWKKRKARKAAGEDYRNDSTYQNVSKTKRIIGIVCVVSFVLGVALVPEQSPEEKARIQAEQQAKAEKEAAEKAAKEAQSKAEKEKENLERASSLTGEEKSIYDAKFQEYLNSMDESSAREKALGDVDTALKAKAEAMKKAEKDAAEAKKKQDAMNKDMTTGWNTSTTDADSDDTNWNKAANLLKTYASEIRNMEAGHPNPDVIMKKPWEYYGKVVVIGGRVYGIQQLPPGNSIPKFFGQECAHTMMSCGMDTTMSVYVVGDLSKLHEKANVRVKGLIYGHVGLENTVGGGHSQGLGFIGFVE